MTQRMCYGFLIAVAVLGLLWLGHRWLSLRTARTSIEDVAASLGDRITVTTFDERTLTLPYAWSVQPTQQYVIHPSTKPLVIQVQEEESLDGRRAGTVTLLPGQRLLVMPHVEKDHAGWLSQVMAPPGETPSAAR